MNHKKTIDWMKLNQMIDNPKKFQAMFISKKRSALPRLKTSNKLHRNNATVLS